MRFGDFGELLIFIWVVPLLVVFYLWAVRHKNTAMERFAQKELLGEIAPAYGRNYAKLRIFLNIAAALFIVLALSKPQWGFKWRDVKSKGVDVVFAVDTSNSMLAVDMPPNRLSFTKEELREFVRKL
ncbi:MAG: hypothetical protein HQ594_02470, partial [Candidatus Omnitrophica bacterium]|nr:hypothetical protein [Candidatus Omnitrophota bacterium]